VFVRSRAARPSAAGRARGVRSTLPRPPAATRELRAAFPVPLAAACGRSRRIAAAFPAETLLAVLETSTACCAPVRPLTGTRRSPAASRCYVRCADRPSARHRRSRSSSPPRSPRSRAMPRAVTLSPYRRETATTRKIIRRDTTPTPHSRLLRPPRKRAERRVLGGFRYSTNCAVLHTDRRFLRAGPPQRVVELRSPTATNLGGGGDLLDDPAAGLPDRAVPGDAHPGPGRPACCTRRGFAPTAARSSPRRGPGRAARRSAASTAPATAGAPSGSLSLGRHARRIAAAAATCRD